MFHPSLSRIFAGLLLVILASQAWAVTPVGSDKIEKVKASVNKRNGEKVVVTMKNGSKVKGVVSNVLEESFDLVDLNTRQPTTIPYRDVEKVKKQGWSSGAKVALGVAIVVAVVVASVFATEPILGPICPMGC